MLVLSRELGESILLDDVALTVARIAESCVELSLVKTFGGRPAVITLRRNETVEICYNVEVALVAVRGAKVRLGFNVPREVNIQRSEFKKPQ